MSLSLQEVYDLDKKLCHCDEKGNPISIDLAELVYHLYKRVNELEAVCACNQVEITHLETPRSRTDTMDDERFDAVTKTLDAIMSELSKMKKTDQEHKKSVSKTSAINKNASRR